MTTPTTSPSEMKPAKSNRMTMYIIVAVIVIIIVGAAVYVYTQSGPFTPDVVLHLKGNATKGWNDTLVGPTINVKLNQKIQIVLLSEDSNMHNFVIAYSKVAPSATPASGDVASKDFSSPTTPYFYNFTVTTSGTFKYYCQYHFNVMVGTITIT